MLFFGSQERFTTNNIIYKNQGSNLWKRLQVEILLSKSQQDGISKLWFVYFPQAHPPVWQLLTSHQVSFALRSTSSTSTPMGKVWEVMETVRGFCFLNPFSLCQCYGYLRNADSTVSADHGTLQEMTITTKAKYDSKCHGVPLSCGRVATSDRVKLVSLHTEQTAWPAVCFQRSVRAEQSLFFWSTNCWCSVPVVCDQYLSNRMLKNVLINAINNNFFVMGSSLLGLNPDALVWNPTYTASLMHLSLTNWGWNPTISCLSPGSNVMIL